MEAGGLFAGVGGRAEIGHRDQPRRQRFLGRARGLSILWSATSIPVLSEKLVKHCATAFGMDSVACVLRSRSSCLATGDRLDPMQLVPACHVDPPTVESGRVVVSWDLAADFLPERIEVWDAVLTTFGWMCLKPTVWYLPTGPDFAPMGCHFL
jgi:hypothetical protein